MFAYCNAQLHHGPTKQQQIYTFVTHDVVDWLAIFSHLPCRQATKYESGLKIEIYTGLYVSLDEQSS